MENQTLALDFESRALSSLSPYAGNARTHSAAQINKLAQSLVQFGWTVPILVDELGEIVAGHGRLLAAKAVLAEGWAIPGWSDASTAPVLTKRGLSPEQKRAYRLLDNRIATEAGWDKDLLALELAGLQSAEFDLALTGFDKGEIDELLTALSGKDPATQKADAKSALADRFLVAPFTVLDARRGWWKSRKDSWIKLGLKSEAGRGELLTFSTSSQPPAVYQAKEEYEVRIGRKANWDEFLEACPDVQVQSGTSIFDPVLCELAYRWFSAPGAMVLDPFAGGSVRGVVAAMTGRQYVGCDLRAEQVDANRVQWAEIGRDHDGPAPTWHCGDSCEIDQHCAGIEADFVFSCPPYADLEVYSDDPRDISTMGYADFLTAYRVIIAKTVAMLKPDRFACFVVGDVRDKRGVYLNFVSDTIAAFRDAGAELYNEAILITPGGSLAMRAGKAFTVSRKLGKAHQNVLVFVKGDPRAATDACGDVALDESLFAEAVDER
ncbi:ParB N-terminal domain-containing protein [Chitinimonas sp.]|uniref:ParB N-terminal domain-containing protein n=1 Tax=Chitinimonas sp. TaxID=1934313 RepID=UPI0035B0BDAF